MTVDSHEEQPSGRARQRERTRRALLAAGAELIQRGVVPTVEEAAATAELSPATGYRYFPSRGALLMALVEEAFPQGLDRALAGLDASARIDAIIDFGFPHIVRSEALDRAILELALRQWRRHKAGGDPSEQPVRRPGRIGLVALIVEPLRERLDPERLRRLELGLGMVLGMESYVALSDIYELPPEEIKEIWRFACKAMLHQATRGGQQSGA